MHSNFGLAMIVRMALTPSVEAIRQWEKDSGEVDLYGENWGEAAQQEEGDSSD